MMSKLILCLAVALACPAFAAPVMESIDPSVTASGVTKAKGPHEVTIDPLVASNGLVLIAIGGTNSSPAQFRYVTDLAASMGYRTLGIDYPNSVICTSCQPSQDRACFDNLREELVVGTDLSPMVTIMRGNAILPRIDALFAYLMKREPQKWSDLAMADGTLDWKKVVVIGHSQGAGHAAYVGKLKAVHRVVMTGGPHDKGRFGLADWVVKPGLTSPDRIYAFLHEKDFFDVRLQSAVVRGLLADSQAPSLSITDTIPQAASDHIFVTNVPAPDPHNSLSRPAFENVWRFLLRP